MARENNSILACIWSKPYVEERNTFVIDPQSFDWGETIKVPAHWRLQKVVRLIAERRELLWHRIADNIMHSEWFATIESTGVDSMVRVKFDPQKITAAQATFLQISDEEMNGEKFIKVHSKLS